MKKLLLYILRKTERPSVDLKSAYQAVSIHALDDAKTANERTVLYQCLSSIAAKLGLFEEAELARRNAEALRAADNLQLAFAQLLTSGGQSK